MEEDSRHMEIRCKWKEGEGGEAGRALFREEGEEGRAHTQAGALWKPKQEPRQALGEGLVDEGRT
jgi:hypothetical protein